MIKREMQQKLTELAKAFPVVALVGPRQAGKTTLAQATFPGHAYVSLEDLDLREFAKSDPRSFLEHYSDGQGVIIDEVQYALGLLSYIQTRVDRSKERGKFILTGSQNFLLTEHMSQTLAGRVATLTLLPLSISELSCYERLPDRYEQLLFLGGYAPIHIEEINPLDWYPNYVRTYVERDVRQIKNITNLTLFQRFLKLCAGRIGQLINWADLARDCGISSKTARSWMTLLEASYLVFLLPPYHNSFSKRVVKSPKLYFYDTALACSLLEIQSEKQLETHYLKGALFESLIVVEMAKARMNRGRPPSCSFWRDKAGHEVDCLIAHERGQIPVEIKSGRTIGGDFFKGLDYWNSHAGSDPSDAVLVYGGLDNQKRRKGRVVSWQNVAHVVE